MNVSMTGSSNAAPLYRIFDDNDEESFEDARDGSEKECSICLKTISPSTQFWGHDGLSRTGERIGHVFHLCCAAPWINQKVGERKPVDCPICRQDLAYSPQLPSDDADLLDRVAAAAEPVVVEGHAATNGFRVVAEILCMVAGLGAVGMRGAICSAASLGGISVGIVVGFAGVSDRVAVVVAAGVAGATAVAFDNPTAVGIAIGASAGVASVIAAYRMRDDGGPDNTRTKRLITGIAAGVGCAAAIGLGGLNPATLVTAAVAGCTAVIGYIATKTNLFQ